MSLLLYLRVFRFSLGCRLYVVRPGSASETNSIDAPLGAFFVCGLVISRFSGFVDLVWRRMQKVFGVRCEGDHAFLVAANKVKVHRRIQKKPLFLCRIKTT